MKEKRVSNGKELENSESELFETFDPQDELWIVGGSTSSTAMATFTPSGVDAIVDMDYFF